MKPRIPGLIAATFALTLLSASYAKAQPVNEFTPAWQSSETEYSTSVMFGDWDYDDDLDPLFGNEAGANRVYKNNESLGTSSAATTTETDATYSVAWGDVDSDGDLDFAAGNQGQANRIYLNSGGLFSLDWSTAQTDNTRSVLFADYDMDGDIDLGVGNATGSNRVYENDGAGGFTLAWTSSETDDTRSIDWGDYDKDGDFDLAAGNYAEANRVYRNDGFGTLASVWTSASELDLTWAVKWGDYDGDQDPDLAVANYGEANRLYQTGGGTFTLLTSTSQTENSTSAAWGDTDSDGDIDLLYGNDNQANRLYQNNGLGSFSSIYVTTETEHTRAVELGDYDGDADLDFVVANWGEKNRYYNNYDDPTSTKPTAPTITAEPDQFIYGATDTIALAWSAGSDAETTDTDQLTYDVRIGTVSGSCNVFCGSFPSLGGTYRGSGRGNTGSGTSLDIELATGTYYWSVRTVDASYDRSAWSAEDSFTVTAMHQISFSWSESDQSMGGDIGDYDGDGDLDLAAANYGTFNSVYAYGSNFALAWISTETDLSMSVEWGDYDGDGDLDQVVANDGEANRIYRNNGFSNLLLIASTAQTEFSYDAAWADIDNDGDLDFGVANFGEPNRVYRNDGSSVFTSVWTSPESDSSAGLEWADYDRDGDMDMAFANAGAEANRIYRNDGDGSFTLDWTSSESETTNDLVWGDFDSDGDLDLAAANSNSGAIRVYRNGGGSAFTSAWASSEFEETSSVAWGDHDADGDLDLLAANLSNQPNRIYKNNAGIDFSVAWVSPEEDVTSKAMWADFDADGDLDIFTVNQNVPNQIYDTLLNWGATVPTTPTLTAEPSLYVLSATATIVLEWGAGSDAETSDTELLTYDLRIGTSSGGCEVFCGSFPSSGVSPYLGARFGNVGATGSWPITLATGTYYWSVRTVDPMLQRSDWAAEDSFDLTDEDLSSHWTSTQTEETYAVAWGDYDGDGDLDVAVGNSGQANRIYANDGLAGLSSAWTSSGEPTDATRAVAWGDIDNDGDLDLAVGNSGGKNRIYRNDSPTVLTLVWSSTETDATLAVAWADFDNDGDMDLAAGNGSNQKNRVYSNLGIGSFSLLWSTSLSNWTESIQVADLNGDGYMDIVAGNRGQPNRSYLGNGAFSFTLDWTSAETDDTKYIALGDYNADGSADVAVANYAQANQIYENDGAGGMSLVWLSGETENSTSADWGDYDGDGDLDLAIGNDGETNRVYVNDGAGSFPTSWDSDETDATQAVAWGDLDGDGDLDLFAGNWSGESNRLHRNNLAIVNTTPVAPTPVAEPDSFVSGADLDVALEWSAGSDAETTDANLLTYDLRVGTTPGGCEVFCGLIPNLGSSPLANGFGNAGATLTHTLTLAPDTYYWQVRTVDAAFKRSAWSTMDLFTLTNDRFASLWINSTTQNVLSVDWGDCDGDGDLDLAAGVFQAPNKIYENDGTGDFTALWTTPQSDESHSVVWGDHDNDGDLDLLVGNFGKPNRVYENDGAGSFALAWSASVTNTTYSADWADANADGYLDIAAANNAKANTVYENDGAGGYDLIWSSTETANSYWNQWGDYDGDGDPDILVANYSAENAVYTNNGGGDFTLDYKTIGQTEKSYMARWGDYDGDGDLDFLIANENQANRFMRNNGGASFSVVWTSTETDPTRGISLGDYDNDGDLDFAAANSGGTASNRVYAGNGAGSFSVVWNSDTAGWTVSVAWGDADGDGDLDLALGKSAQNSPRVLSNSINPTTTAPVAPVLTVEPDAELGAGIGTVTLAWVAGSDAETTDADLLTYDLRVGTTSGGCEIFCGTFPSSGAAPAGEGRGNVGHALSHSLTMETGTFYWSVRTVDLSYNRSAWSAEDDFTLTAPLFGSIWTPSETESSYSAQWGDFDGDGDLDIAVANVNAGVGQQNRVYRNDGDGSFASIWTSSEAEETRELVWGDYDNDGNLDLAAANGASGGQTNRVYRNLGTGSFSSVWNSTEIEQTSDIAWGDYDNDGDLDLAAANDAATTNRVYRNDGSNAFTAAWSSAETDSTVGVAWADADLDGDLDLAFSNSLAANIVHRNEGSDAFTSIWASGEVEDSSPMAWGDYDGDGDMDLAAPNLGGANRIYENQGSFAFVSFWTSASASDTFSIDWGDYDRDGDIDIAEANDLAPNRILSNDGMGAFAEEWVTDESEESRTAFWGDHDGDGDLDLLVANVNAGQINRLYQSNGPAGNAAPGPPSAIAIDDAYILGATTTAILQWTAGSDVETTNSALLTYELMVGTTSGGCEIYCGLFSPFSGTDCAAVGFGPLGSADSHFLTLATGTYYWSVRTVDPSFSRSSWSAQDSFDVIAIYDSVWTDSSGYDTRAAALADFDADGQLDLATANYGQSNRVYINFAAGELFDYWGSAQLDGSQSVAWADWDNDGDLDLAFGNDAQVNRLYESDGNGGLTLAWSSAESEDTRSIAWADYDGDGDMDLLAGNDGGGAGEFNRLYENDGAGGLTSAWASTESEQTTAVAWMDYDEDGDMDFVAGNYAAANRVYKNDGGGTFSSAWDDGGAEPTMGAAWGDFDGDGDMDLAFANDSAANSVYSNDGSDAFTQAWASMETDETWTLNWGDFDGDGDFDLLAGNNGGQANRIYVNDGIGGLTLYWSSLEEENTSAAIWADIVGGDDLDIIAVTGGPAGGGANREYENNLNPANTMPSAPALADVANYDLTGAETSAAVVLNWSGGSDAETADSDLLTYDLRLGTTAGGCEIFCGFFTILDDPSDLGVGLGSLGATESYSIVLPIGTYHWSARTVDPTFERSEWAAKDTFSVGIETDPPSFAGLEEIRGCGSGCLELNWTAATDALGSTPIDYSVYQATVSGGQNFSSAATVTQNTSAQIDGLADGTAYYFVVRAKDSLGNEESNAIQIAAAPVDPPAFTKHGANPRIDVSAGRFDSDAVESPSAPVWIGDRYYLWYTGDDGTARRIGLAVSYDLSHWNKIDGSGSGGSVIDLGSGFDSAGAEAPSVIYNGGQYRMWYVGDDGSAKRVGYATSDDGAMWTKQAGSGTGDSAFEGDGAGFDADSILAFKVIQNDANYLALYEGYDSGTGLSRIGSASSSDGIAWTAAAGADANGSVLAEDGAGFDADAAYRPDPIAVGSEYQALYVGTSGGVDRLGFANSVDGQTWIRHDGQGTGGSLIDNDDAFDTGGLNWSGSLYDGTQIHTMYATPLGIGYANTSGDFEPALIAITVTPDTDVVIGVGGGLPFAATCSYTTTHSSCGASACDCTDIVKWESSDETTATIDSFGLGAEDGLAQGLKLGSADITASLAGIVSDPVTLSITNIFESYWISSEAEANDDADWGDYDGDGDLDVAVAGLINRIYRNDSGDFVADWSSAESEASKSVDWGDYDNDGDLDLAFGNENLPDRVYRNDGDGSFTSVWVSFESEFTSQIEWGDYDNDGDLDLAAGHTNSRANRLYRNAGGGVFYSVSPFSTTESTLAIAWGDYDVDGDLDLAEGNWTGLNNRIHRNDGGGTFVNVYTDSLTENTYAVAWGDVDGDGDLDLYVGNWEQPNRIYKNGGGDAFSRAWATSESSWTKGVDWGDYDNDGDLDIVVANNEQGKDEVYSNDGDSTMTLVWKSSETNHGEDAAWSDFDGDGDLDFFIVNDTQANQLYRNNLNPANAAPTAPVLMAAANINSGYATLNWSAGSDSESPSALLTYDLRVGSTSGGCEVFCGSFPSGAGSTAGNGFGNVGAALSHELLFASGTVYWSVRTVDSALQRGGWSAEDSFEVANSGVFVPATPALSSMTSSASYCEPHWKQSAGSSITYKVHRCEGDLTECTSQEMFTTVSTEVVNLYIQDATVVAEKMYTYCATAVNQEVAESPFTDDIASDCQVCSTAERPDVGFVIELVNDKDWNLLGVSGEPKVTTVAGNFETADYDELYYMLNGRYLDANAAGFEGFKKGQGYWIHWKGRARSDYEKDFVASPVTPTSVRITLNEGWNLVANPYLNYVDWVGNKVQISVNGATMNIDDAISQGVTSGVLYRWDVAASDYVKIPFDTGGFMAPYKGYLLKVNVSGVELVVKKPQ